MHRLVAKLYDPWYPDGAGGWTDPPAYYGEFTDPQQLSVTITANDVREATLAVPQSHPLAFAATDPYWYMLAVWWRGDLVFYGPTMPGEIDDETGVATINASGPEIRAVNHFIRRGDEALNSSSHPTLPNPYNRKVPPNGEGLRMLRDAAELSAAQLLEYPPLGIRNGFDDTDSIAVGDPSLVAFSRGDQVFTSMQDITGLLGGADMEISPVWGVPGVYADLNTYTRQGTTDATHDRTFTEDATGDGALAVRFHAGWGLDNCHAKFSQGPIVTHVHVLSADGKRRVTRANVAAAETYGVWVRWEQTNFKASNVAALELRGDQILAAYSKPPVYAEIRPKPTCQYRYLEHYMVGTEVFVSEKNGNGTYEHTNARITKVTLEQLDASGTVNTRLEVIPTTTVSAGTDGTD